jgi:hypothetical protein
VGHLHHICNGGSDHARGNSCSSMSQVMTVPGVVLESLMVQLSFIVTDRAGPKATVYAVFFVLGPLYPWWRQPPGGVGLCSVTSGVT